MRVLFGEAWRLHEPLRHTQTHHRAQSEQRCTAVTFIAVVIPSLTHFPQIFAGVSSGTAALIFQFLPFNLWIIVSAIFGIIAGTSSSYLMHARDTKNEKKP